MDETPTHDLTVMNDSHLMLTQTLLTKALRQIERVFDYELTGEAAEDYKLQMRLLSLKAKTATATANMVIHLGDGSLRRQAGAKMDRLMEIIRAAHPEKFQPATIVDNILEEP